MMNPNPQILLETARLILRLPCENDIAQIQNFDGRNQKHLAPWKSGSKEETIDYKAQLAQWEKEFCEGKSIRFLILLKENPMGEVIGFCNFSQIFRGPFQACYLGYQHDAAFQCKGLMLEAVDAAIKYMFEKQNFHRIMANYMPSNERSARLLQKLGFAIEGEAKNYLLINGQWEDHVLTSLTNNNWIPKR